MKTSADPHDGARDGLNNHWYVACIAQRLRRKPIVATVMSRDIVLFRTAYGSPAAIENRCAHRGMPLAEGRVREGLLRCARCPDYWHWNDKIAWCGMQRTHLAGLAINQYHHIVQPGPAPHDAMSGRSPDR
jgi:vanillate O-demethylase monooxygenase subunit